MASAETQAPGKQRPLSPHLQIFRPYINMVMSIWHRITGVALYFGTLLLAWWLISAAVGPRYFAFVNDLLASPLGLLVLLGFTWALLHHLVGGLRHLIWDTGRAFSIGSVRTLSWLTVLLSLSLTIAIWAWVMHVKGWY
ncbi:MAG: succinate dehydrogenase, cytochrome b556 subunit [Proteobacteria bacterium]|nr:succinate dehydrogenase, cytochrome b556 subunit [Pseudomonadota bacterium]